MQLLRCPKEEELLQYLSVPVDFSTRQRLGIRFHLLNCPQCREKKQHIHDKLTTYFTPEPDITSSLLKVYSRLQQDETLILKGWKLGKISTNQKAARPGLVGGWLFRGGIALGLGSLALFFALSGRNEVGTDSVAQKKPSTPFAQIRFQDKNRVQVHYVESELIKSVEFETTGLR